LPAEATIDRATPNLEVSPRFSPDGRFVAYRSDDSGGPEIHVTPCPGPGPRHQISTQGGRQPRWSRDGREIFFVSHDQLWAASVRTAPSFASEPPHELFER
jgi:Tol biopolymer transport system component